MKILTRVRTLIGLGLLATFLWKFFRRREARHARESSIEVTYEQQRTSTASLRTDATGAAADTARTASAAAMATTRTGVHSGTAAFAWIRSRFRKAHR